MPAVLQVIQQGEVRGAEMFALDLTGALAREGRWEVSLVSLFGVDEAYKAAASRAGVPVTAVQPDGRARGFSPRLVRRLLAAIEGGRFQIVQANGAATLKYLAVARRLARRPWRLVYRAIGMGSYWRRGVGRRVLYRWLFSQADRIVAVCEAVAEDLRRATRIDAHRVSVVPNGVALARVLGDSDDRAGVRREWGVAPDEHLLVYAGSLAPEKNLGALVRIVAGSRARGVPVKAAIVGDGPGRDDVLREARALGLEDAVLVRPSQTRIGPALAAADLCVLPSLTEGAPALLIEAGLVGVPAVAYAVGGIPEIVEHGVTGLLAPPRDEVGLAGAVQGLLQDAARRRKMGTTAARRYRRFEIGRVGREYGALYNALLADGDAPGRA